MLSAPVPAIWETRQKLGKRSPKFCVMASELCTVLCDAAAALSRGELTEVEQTLSFLRMDNFHTFVDMLKQHAKPLAEKAEMRKKLAPTLASALIQAVAALAAPPAATASAAAGARLAALALVQVAVKNSSDAAMRSPAVEALEPTTFVEDIVAEIASSSLKVTATSAPILRSAVEGEIQSRGAGDAKVLCAKIFGKMLKTMSQTDEDLTPQYCTTCRDAAAKAGAAQEIESTELLLPDRCDRCLLGWADPWVSGYLALEAWEDWSSAEADPVNVAFRMLLCEGGDDQSPEVTDALRKRALGTCSWKRCQEVASAARLSRPLRSALAASAAAMQGAPALNAVP
eukprot:s830_g4.t1